MALFGQIEFLCAQIHTNLQIIMQKNALKIPNQTKVTGVLVRPTVAYPEFCNPDASMIEQTEREKLIVLQAGFCY